MARHDHTEALEEGQHIFSGAILRRVPVLEVLLGLFPQLYQRLECGGRCDVEVVGVRERATRRS